MKHLVTEKFLGLMGEKVKSWTGSKAGQWQPGLVVLFIKLQFPQAGWAHSLADLCPCQGKPKNDNFPKLSLPLGWCLVTSFPKHLINYSNLLTHQDTFKMMSFMQKTSTNPVIDALPLQVQKHSYLFGSLYCLALSQDTYWVNHGAGHFLSFCMLPLSCQIRSRADNLAQTQTAHLHNGNQSSII